MKIEWKKAPHKRIVCVLDGYDDLGRYDTVDATGQTISQSEDRGNRLAILLRAIARRKREIACLEKELAKEQRRRS